MSSQPQIAEPKTVTITNSAFQKVYELLKEEGTFTLKLRVYIEGGGCSGFQYGFNFEEEEQFGDFVITKKIEELEENEEDEGGEGGSGTVAVVIDPMSYQYLVGAEIDYKDDLDGARFIIRNPNAKTTCGCGSSFAV